MNAEEIASQERSRLVKKKRHGDHKVLIPLGTKRRERGGKKSRRTYNKNVWVDPKLLEDELGRRRLGR